MSSNFAIDYAKSMKQHPYGFALYQPESSSVLQPGSCGYLNKFGRWQPITNVNDESALTSVLGKHEPLTAALVLMPLQEMTWGPKTSTRMKCNKVKASGSASGQATGIPASVSVVYKFQSLSDFGAILHCPSKVQHQGYYHRAVFTKWAQSNADNILEKFPEVKDDGFWVVTDTYSTKNATINAWKDRQRRVAIEFTVDIVQTGEIGPSGEFAQRTTGQGWTQFDAQEGDNLVIFFSGIHVKYRWLRLGKDSLKEVKGEQPVVIADPMNKSNLYEVEYEIVGDNVYHT